MQKVACKFRLKTGMQAEYKRRHDEIGPEMLKVFERAGIHNFTIWNVGDELFSYYEVEDYVKCNKVLTESETIRKWNLYMDDLIQFEVNPATGRMVEMDLMFKYNTDE